MSPRIARWLSVVAWCLLLKAAPVPAAPLPFQLAPNDVVAFVGGEDVVEMQRNCFLEMLITLSFPTNQLRFRSLAWEGDTVFEQRRDLNFPPLAKQLERVGATVVFAQFGQSEAMRADASVEKFIAAYEKLLDTLASGGRKVVLLSPTPIEPMHAPFPDLTTASRRVGHYGQMIREMAQRRGVVFVDLLSTMGPRKDSHPTLTRDGLHLVESSHRFAADVVIAQLGLRPRPLKDILMESTVLSEQLPAFHALIAAKNQLWFDYWRPQNWAFLAGDRTEQPSSRDHKNPKVRWFPQELEEFLPLIAAKEREIGQWLAKNVNGGNLE